MISAWRLISEHRIQEAFTGEGARLYGGRWNHRGIRVVYLSETLALAALEQFVHVGFEGRYMKYACMHVSMPESISMTTVNITELPEGWDETPISSLTMDIGTAWAKGLKTAVLKVPSAIIPVENNYLLNPQHPEFKQITIDEPQLFGFDPRIWKSDKP